MAWKFVVNDEYGNVQIDIGSRVFRGIQSFPTGGVSGSAAVSGVETGTPLIINIRGGPNSFPPQVSLSGNILTWTYPFSQQFSRAGNIYVVVY